MSGNGQKTDERQQRLAREQQNETPIPAESAQKRFFLTGENRWIRITVSARRIKTISKNGIEQAVKEMRARGEKI